VHEPLLDNAVLAGVIREHGDAPLRDGCIDHLVDGVGQHVEFGVHLDPDGLERALGRMATGPSSRRRDRGGDHGGELGCGLDGPRRHDRLGDAAREALVAVSADEAGELIGFIAVHDIGCRPWLRTVHAHVERSVVAITEAALGAIELQR